MEKFINYLEAEANFSLSHLEIIRSCSNVDQSAFLASLLQQEELDSDRVLQRLAAFLNLKFDYIDERTVDVNLKDLISRDWIKNYRVMPLFKLGSMLFLAVNNPFQPVVFEQLERKLGLCVSCVLTTTFCFDRVYNYIYDRGAVLFDIKNSSVVETVDRIFAHAVRDQVSDIHFEAFQDTTQVRFRVDGLLKDVHSFPKSMHYALLSRIKVMANMDITELRKPQDGRLIFNFENRKIDFRVSTVTTISGEKLVLRILDRASAYSDLGDLGFSRLQLDILDPLLSSSSGIVVVCGPTGSGKTSTLYSVLNKLNGGAQNIVTIEDPVEYKFKGMNQVSVNPAIDLTFASGLKSILRQDPDVILVGEIRDFETSSVAIQAALTGHLVFTTLHTRSAAGTMTRLLDMGHKPFLLNSTILAVVSQRLLRKLCLFCKYQVSDQAIDSSAKSQHVLSAFRAAYGGLPLMSGRGCRHCSNTGYRGRTGIFEVMPFQDSLRQAVSTQNSELAIHKCAIESGMMTIQQHALEKLKLGITSVTEVLRVLDF
eukprot:COSAG01_NODE_4_length_55812_cov_1344.168109_20_plen_540_part_00